MDFVQWEAVLLIKARRVTLKGRHTFFINVENGEKITFIFWVKPKNVMEVYWPELT